MKKALPLLYFLLSLLTEQSEISYQVFNQSSSNPCVSFYGKQADNITLSIEMSQYAAILLLFLRTSAWEMSVPQAALNEKSWVYKTKLVMTSKYLAQYMIAFEGNPTITSIKITLSINDNIILEEYQLYGGNEKQIYELQTFNPCKIRLYWYGENATLALFQPGENIFSENYYFSKSISNNNFFDVDLNNSGKWYIASTNNQTFSLSGGNLNIMNITTFTQSQCTNNCSDKEYPVVGKAQGTQNMCICDKKIPNLLWDQLKQKCTHCELGTCTEQNPQVNTQSPTQDPSKGPTQDPPQGGLSTGAIVGIVVSIIGFFIITIILICLFFIKLKKVDSEASETFKTKTQKNLVSTQNIEQQDKIKQSDQSSQKPKQPQQINPYTQQKIKQSDESSQKPKQPQQINPYTQCAICLVNQCNIALQCKHIFHRKCIFQWLKNEKQCPLCRRDPMNLELKPAKINENSASDNKQH